MKTIKHISQSRGFANHGWLKSYHTFSFAGYFNPERMNFGKLRVFNDDVVQPKMGFGTHPHNNMEIISIPLKGALSHKDSMDNKRSIEVGEVQVMSAGTGLTHSEFNDSKTEEVNFLQLCIVPEKENVTPNYEQKKFDKNKKLNQFLTVVSPQDKLVEGSLGIHQQAYIKIGNFKENSTINYSLAAGNGAYVFVIDGSLIIENDTLNNRDAIGIWDTTNFHLDISSNSEVLIIEVPMN